MCYDKMIFLISTLAILLSATAVAQPVAATINASHPGQSITRLIFGGFMEPATTGGEVITG